MWVLVFYMSYGFGSQATGGPAAIPGFQTLASCQYAASQLGKELPEGKLDMTKCIKVTPN